MQTESKAFGRRKFNEPSQGVLFGGPQLLHIFSRKFPEKRVGEGRTVFTMYGTQRRGGTQTVADCANPWSPGCLTSKVNHRSASKSTGILGLALAAPADQAGPWEVMRERGPLVHNMNPTNSMVLLLYYLLKASLPKHSRRFGPLVP